MIPKHCGSYNCGKLIGCDCPCAPCQEAGILAEIKLVRDDVRARIVADGRDEALEECAALCEREAKITTSVRSDTARELAVNIRNTLKKGA